MYCKKVVEGKNTEKFAKKPQESISNVVRSFGFPNISQESLDRLEYLGHSLCKWGKTVNLVSRGTLDNIWVRHVIDSLQVIDKIRGTRVLDIGTGAGFPGMVIAMCTDFEVTCIDSDSKKTLFLEEVARGAQVRNIKILNQRVESLSGLDEKFMMFDTVTARAFSSLDNLIPLVKQYSGYGVFLKGKSVTEEIEKASKDYAFEYELFDSKTDPNGKLITISNVCEKRMEDNGKGI